LQNPGDILRLRAQQRPLSRGGGLAIFFLRNDAILKEDASSQPDFAVRSVNHSINELKECAVLSEIDYIH
jgi:hypothetical protein